MFTLSFRITKRRLAALAAVAVLAVAGGFWAKAAASELNGAAASSHTEIRKIEKTPGETNAQRIAFLQSFGWQVAEEPEEVMEVLIPKEFDEVYTRYNALQKEQSCDLTRYAGRRCKRYSYSVANYPGQNENIRANLLIYNGRIVGGDVCSLSADGFMQGFARTLE